MRRISFLFFLGAQFFLLSSCQQNAPSQFWIHRLIDSFGEENIIRSPFQQFSEEAEENKHLFPVQSFPLEELGTGDNPFLLKRKIKVGREYLSSLYAPPESRYDFRFKVRNPSILEFGVGIVRDKFSFRKERETANASRVVEFVILLEISGEEKTIYRDQMTIPSSEARQAFVIRSVDLSPYQGEMRLSLLTSGQEGTFSFWFNPVLFPKGKSARQVILISVDTLRADHLGCYGYERPTSPNLDTLAEESALFANAYAPSPWTLPSHVSMLTALNTVHHQVYHQDQRMSRESITLAELLKTDDFFCSAFTGGGFVSAAFGFADGFDSYYERTDEIVLDSAAELCYRDVARWIDSNRDRDFFLFIHTYQPHDPYASPQPYKTRFLSDRAQWSHLNLMGHLGGKSGIFKPLSQEERQNIVDLYDGEILYTDEKLIGPLIDKLKKLSLYDQTMIVFTSDHGEEFFDHGGWGHGQNLYDESLKVPLLIKFPGQKFKGRRVENIISLVDILPTILDEFGIGWPRTDFDGKSLTPLLRGKEKGHRTFLADVGENILDLHLPQKMATNEGQFKFILNKQFRPEDKEFFRFPPAEIKALELFDLLEDPFETNNIAEKKAGTAQRLLRKLEVIYAQNGDQNKEQAVLDEELKQQLRALGYIK